MKELTFVMVLATMFAFQNCNQAQFSMTPKAAALTDDEEKFHEVETACSNGTIEHHTYNISFPSNLNASNTVCQWRQSSGSPVIAEEVVMARNEESKTFQLPAGATLCEMTFQIQNQTFRYDDMFFLNFNDVVLVSATSWFHGMPNWNGLETYSWNALDGVAWPPAYNSSSWIYCAGADQGLGTCTVPPTETAGNFHLTFDKTLIQKIGTRGTNQHEFKLVVTGDNNPSIDCRHEALSFSVNVSYVLN